MSCGATLEKSFGRILEIYPFLWKMVELSNNLKFYVMPWEDKTYCYRIRKCPSININSKVYYEIMSVVEKLLANMEVSK